MKILYLGQILPGQTSFMCMRAIERLGHVVRGVNTFDRRSAPKYFLTTTCPDDKVNLDTVTPYWRRINLQLPFNFPPPLHLIKDFLEDQQGKCLGVWRMEDLGLDHFVVDQL